MRRSDERVARPEDLWSAPQEVRPVMARGLTRPSGPDEKRGAPFRINKGSQKKTASARPPSEQRRFDEVPIARLFPSCTETLSADVLRALRLDIVDRTLNRKRRESMIT
jgi:hypothetical protein